MAGESNGNGKTVHADGPYGGVSDPILVNRLIDAVNQARTHNASLTSRAWGRGLTDPRRDLEDECGYPGLNDPVPVELYRQLYDRDAVAARVVEILPKECWQKPPTVVEGKGAVAADSKDSPFVKAVEELGKRLNGRSWLNTASANALWGPLYQFDVLMGIGHFGALLLGFDDGGRLDTPVDGSVEYETQADGSVRNVTDSPPHDKEDLRVWNAAARERLKNVKGMESVVLNDKTEDELLKDDLASGGTLGAYYARNGGVYGLNLNSAAYNAALKGGGRGKFSPTRTPGAKAPPRTRPGARPPGPDGASATGSRRSPPTPAQAPLGTDAQYYDWGGTGSPGSSGGSSPQETPGQGEGGEAQGFQPRVNLLYLRAYDEPLVQIVRYEWDYNSPRFGLPVMYRITLNDPKEVHSGIGLPLATVMVHWSRVVHGTDPHGQPSSSKCFSPPRQRVVLNNILGLRKISCGDPEGYYKACVPILGLSTHPQLGGDVVVNKPQLKDTVEQVMNGLQRDLLLTGMTGAYIAPPVADPTAHKDLQIGLICVKIGCPVPVFQGYEIGEQASTNNDSQWDDQKRSRMENHCTPNVVAPFFDRLIAVGCLPEPADGYGVVWPSPEASDAEQADVFTKRMTAFAAWVSGGVEAVLPPRSMLIREAGYSEEEADEILEEGEAHKEEMVADQQAQIDAGLAPDPTEPQPQKLGAGQSLVHPGTGKEIAKGPPLPPKAVPPGGKPNPFAGK